MVSQAERLSRGSKVPQRVNRWVLMCESSSHSPHRQGTGMRSPHYRCPAGGSPHSRCPAGGRQPLDCVTRCHQTLRAHGYST